MSATPDARGEDALVVVAAPPFLTVQDLGRPGHRALGVPAGGAMDRWALQAANLLVGNAPGAAALEWGVGGGALRLARDATLALAGATADATLDGAPVAAWRAVRARAGAVLAVARLRAGRLLYVAVDGGVAVPPVLGSASTYLPAAFGGLHGRRLRSGDALPLGAPAGAAAPPDGFSCPDALRRDVAGERTGDVADDAPVRLVAGPQAALLDDAGWARLLGAAFTVAAASDRTGYRLDGPSVHAAGDATLPSEAGCPGAVQLPPGGQPIVLMADAPTVGGYAKPAVVCLADLGRVAQCAPGDALRFARVTVADAQRAYRRRRVALHTLAELAARAAAARDARLS